MAFLYSLIRKVAFRLVLQKKTYAHFSHFVNILHTRLIVTYDKRRNRSLNYLDYILTCKIQLSFSKSLTFMISWQCSFCHLWIINLDWQACCMWEMVCLVSCTLRRVICQWISSSLQVNTNLLFNPFPHIDASAADCFLKT